MELGEAIRRRRMCRNFTDVPVDPAVVDGLLDLAARAPSAGHTQGWAWLVLEGPELTGRFWALDADPAWLAAPTHPGLLRAPVILVPLSNPSEYAKRYAEPDKAGQRRPGGGAAAFLLGAPAELGLPLEDWPVPWWDVDLSFALMLLLLGAVDAGLGALFFALHRDPKGLLTSFGVPEGWRPLGAIALGHPAPHNPPSASTSRGRRPPDQVIHRGQW